jgi:hypothetical protein
MIIVRLIPYQEFQLWTSSLILELLAIVEEQRGNSILA